MFISGFHDIIEDEKPAGSPCRRQKEWYFMKQKIMMILIIQALILAAAGAAGAAGIGAVPPVFTVEDQFADSDLLQEADLQGAVTLRVSDGAQLTIDSAGVYVLSGTASEACVTVKAGKKDRVQLVLDGVSITNESAPCISVQKADRVFITTTESRNALEVTGYFTGSEKAVIYAGKDLTMNGKGSLSIRSSKDAVTVKGDLRITGGSYDITCGDAAFDARDSIRVCGGQITVNACKDGLHAENNKNDTLGCIYIAGGTVSVSCEDDAVHGNAVIQIDGGDITLQGHEGLESTWIRLNGGTVSVTASDDGINAGRKSFAYEPTVEINGGTLSVVTTTAKCDAIDANGDILIRGGVIDITSGRPFDCDGAIEWTDGQIIVNGRGISPSQINSLIVR